MRVSGNRSTPASALQALAGDNDWQVRVRVARNRKATAAVLTTLASDEHWYVRRIAARHPNTPSSVLKALADDPHRDVRIRALMALTKHTRRPIGNIQILRERRWPPF